MGEYPVYSAILARRSIRRFKAISVEHEKIDMLLKAAMAAPSACNLQPWSFIIVDDPDILTQLKNTTAQGNYNAPLAIVVCGVCKHIPWSDEGWRQDCGAAAQNIMLEGTELGLASVCIGGFDDDDLCKILEIPDDVHPVCIIELGYPDYELAPLTWYTEEAVHWQKYDSKKPRLMRTIQMLEDDARSGKI